MSHYEEHKRKKKKKKKAKVNATVSGGLLQKAMRGLIKSKNKAKNK